MTPKEFSELIGPTLEDRRMSRAERQSLAAVLGGVSVSAADLEKFRHEAFEQAKRCFNGEADRAALDWLEDVVKLLKPAAEAPGNTVKAEAFFSPGDECRRRICSLCRQTRKTLDICVFTITDNEIADAIVDAHRRKVAIRLITDNEKAFDLGSDIIQLQERGVPVRIDQTEHHMHHKYALFDRTTLLTGSYNWTRSAAEHNEENIVITGDPALLLRFQQEFDRLWEQLK